MAAIYMWPVDNQIILTTTLYPVEAIDTILLSATFTTGAMGLIPTDLVESFDEDLLSAFYTQVRWFYEDGPYDDAVESYDEDLLNAFYVQVRWFYEDGPYDDAVESFDEDLYSAFLILKGVIADSPDEELQLSATFTTGSMGLI